MISINLTKNEEELTKIYRSVYELIKEDWFPAKENFTVKIQPGNWHYICYHYTIPVGVISFYKKTYISASCHIALKGSGIGLGTGFSKLAIRDLFENNKEIIKLIAEVREDKRLAFSLAKRLGFKEEGYFKDMLQINNKLIGIHYLGLSKHD